MIRNKTWLVAGAALLVLGACGGTTDDTQSTTSTDTETTTAGGGGGTEGVTCDDVKMGFFGALTGDYAALGINIRDGVKLAIDQFTEANPDCAVTLEEYDSQGSETAAPDLAQQAIDDQTVIGVVGPAFSGESNAAGPIFAEAGLPTITPSATNPNLAENGWATFFRILGNDATQGPAAAKYISETIGSTKVFVMDDASEYGKGLADIVTETLGDAVVETDTTQQGEDNFSASITKIKASGADTLFYGGYYPEAGKLIKQLRNADWQGQMVVGDGVKDEAYVEEGGESTEGTVITCPCLPPDQAPDFFDAYQAAFDTEPGTYTAEGYDAANVFLAGITDGATEREAMLEFVGSYEGQGVTKEIAFDDKGESTNVVVWAYTVKKGKIVPDQEIK